MTPPSIIKRRLFFRFLLMMAALFAASAQPCRAAGTPDYHFQGSISEEVLGNYLSRAITMSNLFDRLSWLLEENIRMLENIGAKFIGRTVLIYANEWELEDILSGLAPQTAQVHAMDPEIIMEAGIFEIICTQVEQIAIPPHVFEAFGLPVETRNFCYEDMLFTCQSPEIEVFPEGCSVPDVSRIETQMWFYHLATSYIDAGIEAIHLGQLVWMSECDPGYAELESLLTRIRAYAAEHARRGLVLLNAHTHGMVREGRLLLDFNEYPLRLKEVEGSTTREVVLEEGFLDSIYGQSLGGVTPSGWTTEHLPYLVEFDHGYAGEEPGGCADPVCVWGYDEVSWLAHLPLARRNRAIREIWTWLENNDPAGYLEMVGMRDIQGIASNGSDWYHANDLRYFVPYGFSQESTIKAIWARNPTGPPISALLQLLMEGGE